jgi:hypothetical protein
VGQQVALARRAADVLTDLAIASDDPVTGQQDRDRVGRHRRGHGPRGAGSADACGQLAVTDRLAGAEFGQRAPDLHLKSGAMQGQSQSPASAPGGGQGVRRTRAAGRRALEHRRGQPLGMSHQQQRPPRPVPQRPVRAGGAPVDGSDLNGRQAHGLLLVA